MKIIPSLLAALLLFSFCGVVKAQDEPAVSPPETNTAGETQPDPGPAEPSPVDPTPADPTPVEPGGAAGDIKFNELKQEWTELLKQLRATLVDYQKATDNDRPALRKKYAGLVAQGKEMLPKLIAAAEASFAADPKADGEPAAFLIEVIQDKSLKREEYDVPARAGLLLVENGVNKPEVLAATGIALYKSGRLKELATEIEGEEKPNQNLVNLLVTSLNIATLRFDDPEPAVEAGQQLISKGVEAKGLDEVTGIALFMTSQYDAAEGPLKKAAAAGGANPLVQRYLGQLDYYKKIWKEEQEFRKSDAAGEPLPQVRLKTNKGDIVVELFENEAPKTVGNFVNLVEKGYYDGLTFHRVLPGFMAQGGCPEGTGGGGPGYRIPDEVRQEKYRKHFRGVLSMAKTPAPDSGGSQFFLTFTSTDNLDGKHTVFGRVIEGIDVLAKLQRRDPDSQKSVKPDTIDKAEVIRKRDHEYKPTIAAQGN